MRLHKINRKGEVEIIDLPFGSKIVGSRFIQIDISPEELLDAWEDIYNMHGYLTKLTALYKKND